MFNPGLHLKMLEEKIRESGYIPRRSDILGIAGALLKVCKDGSKAMVLLGPPGTGKSAFAAAAAYALLAKLIVYQCHQWSDADEFFVGVDVCAAVAGNAELVRQDGVLAKVAKMSQEGPVVLLLDEIDKTMERTEALLLDWLQSGRVPIQPGVHLQTNLENVLGIATSNEQRDLTEAGTRRFCRVVMNPLEVKTQVALIHQRSGVDLGVCKVLWKAARFVAAHEGNNALSIQEGIRLVSAAFFLAESEKDVRILISQWAARSQKGRDMVANSHGDDFSRQSSAAWSEICRGRASA